jgi:hypothetical protein
MSIDFSSATEDSPVSSLTLLPPMLVVKSRCETKSACSVCKMIIKHEASSLVGGGCEAAKKKVVEEQCQVELARSDDECSPSECLLAHSIPIDEDD